MKLLRDFTIAFKSYGKAFTFIGKNKMKRFFLFPMLLNILFYTLGLLAINELTNELMVGIDGYLKLENWTFWGSEAIGNTLQFLIWLVIKILSFLLLVFLGGHIVLILLSPILAHISEKTEQILNKTDYPFNLKQFINDIFRGIAISLRNFAIEISLVIIFFFLSLIPLIGFITAPLLFFASAYYFGFSFIDYNLERKRYSVKQSVSFMKKNKGLAIGNGFVYALVLFIPIIGISIAGFVAILSTVSATLTLQKKNELEGTKSILTA